jgi:3-oxoadipyl-CoA thiolase
MRNGNTVYLCDGIRTPFGRFHGGLSGIRTDDLAALPLQHLYGKYPALADAVDEILLGCANQSGEDNRNVARMAGLLAGLPVAVPAVTVNRLCASGLEAIGQGARAIALGEAEVVLAGGVESMSRAPYVMAKAKDGFDRSQQLEDTTLGWRMINPLMRDRYGVDSMAQTAENVALNIGISRTDQDAFALRSQQRAAQAMATGILAADILPVAGLSRDEQPRSDTSLEKLAGLKAITGEHGSITAGNASSLNDGSCALLLASAKAVKAYGLSPRARITGMASAGVIPRLMGLGPVPAIEKLLSRQQHRLSDIDRLEINEAFAAQVLGVSRTLGLADDDTRLNRHGGALAFGHPLGASGARLTLQVMNEIARGESRRAIVSLCVGVGQGLAMGLETV